MGFNEKFVQNKNKIIAGLLMVAIFCFGLFIGLAQSRATQNNSTTSQAPKQHLAAPGLEKGIAGVCAVKGKFRKRGGKKIYYVQADSPFKRLKGATCFKDEQSARAAGYEKYQRGSRPSNADNTSTDNTSNGGGAGI